LNLSGFTHVKPGVIFQCGGVAGNPALRAMDKLKDKEWLDIVSKQASLYQW
jgi:hypothetical protein